MAGLTSAEQSWCQTPLLARRSRPFGCNFILSRELGRLQPPRGLAAQPERNCHRQRQYLSEPDAPRNDGPCRGHCHGCPKIEPIFESLFFVGVITFLMRFLGLLIKDCDNPFGHYDGGSVEDVSLKPIDDVIARLREIQSHVDDGGAVHGGSPERTREHDD